jgi:hypothetical protein
MAPLDAAIAFAQMDDMPELIAQQLDLDVARLLYVFLYIDVRIAEIRFSFSLGGHETADKLNIVVTDAHAFTAASGRALMITGYLSYWLS